MANEKVYNPDVPDAKDHFNSSQLDFLTNFQILYDAFTRNHVALDATTNLGNHTYIELLSKDASYQTDASDISIYCKPVENQGNQIFLRYPGNQDEFQLSCYQIYSVEKDNYFTFLPGKILLYFGSKTLSTTTVTTNTGISSTSTKQGVIELVPPIATNIVSVHATPIYISTNYFAAYENPTILKPVAQNGFYKQVILRSQNLNKVFYIITANI